MRKFNIGWCLAALSLGIVLQSSTTDRFDPKKHIPFNSEKGKVIYSGRVTIAGASQKEVFKDALISLDDVMPGFKTRILEIDSEKCTVLTRGSELIRLKDDEVSDQFIKGSYQYQMRITCENSGYTYEAQNFEIHHGGKYTLEQYYNNKTSAEFLKKKEPCNEVLQYMDYSIRTKIEYIQLSIEHQMQKN